MHLHVFIIVLKVGQFQDDRQSSRLRTLVAHYTPVQVWIIFNGLVVSSVTFATEIENSV